MHRAISLIIVSAVILTSAGAGEACVAGSAAPQTQPSQSQSSAREFSEQDALRLLGQIRTGLEGNLPRKVLGAFDLSRMNGGPAFRQQIVAFLNQYPSVRFHFDLVEVNGNVAVVDAEMEADPQNDYAAPVRKRRQLRFTASAGTKGWKFIDLEPRAFFS